MTADLPLRLGKIGALLAARMPRVFDATLALLETLSPVLDIVGAERYDIQRPIGHGGHAEVLLASSGVPTASSAPSPSSACAPTRRTRSSSWR